MNVKSQSELDIGGRETCLSLGGFVIFLANEGTLSELELRVLYVM